MERGMNDEIFPIPILYDLAGYFATKANEDKEEELMHHRSSSELSIDTIYEGSSSNSSRDVLKSMAQKSGSKFSELKQTLKNWKEKINSFLTRN